MQCRPATVVRVSLALGVFLGSSCLGVAATGQMFNEECGAWVARRTGHATFDAFVLLPEASVGSGIQAGNSVVTVKWALPAADPEDRAVWHSIALTASAGDLVVAGQHVDLAEAPVVAVDVRSGSAEFVVQCNRENATVCLATEFPDMRACIEKLAASAARLDP